ncbi:MAG: hypothetical protein LBP51_08215, partial [Deferribacteraceae bacterium]|nr:hypothetical protein [Deferribacteraceae bacterium]
GVDNYSWDIPQSNANLLLANVCVATADSADNQSVYMDGLLYCTIEVSLDDNRSLGGNGRLFKGSQSPGDYFDNCNLASGKPAQYLYKIW